MLARKARALSWAFPHVDPPEECRLEGSPNGTPFHPRPSSRRFARPRLRAVRYLGIKVDDAIEIAKKIDIRLLTRYPNQRTWSAAILSSPIAVRLMSADATSSPALLREAALPSPFRWRTSRNAGHDLLTVGPTPTTPQRAMSCRFRAGRA
jgi:hypothetical protein